MELVVHQTQTFFVAFLIPVVVAFLVRYSVVDADTRSMLVRSVVCVRLMTWILLKNVLKFAVLVFICRMRKVDVPNVNPSKGGENALCIVPCADIKAKGPIMEGVDASFAV